MGKDPKTILNDLVGGLEALRKADSKRMQALWVFREAAHEPGALDVKTKHLISLGIALYNRCEYCIVGHTDRALKAGASRKELIETAFVAATMGGGPTIAYSATLLQDSINAFAPDYGK